MAGILPEQVPLPGKQKLSPEIKAAARETDISDTKKMPPSTPTPTSTPVPASTTDNTNSTAPTRSQRKKLPSSAPSPMSTSTPVPPIRSHKKKLPPTPSPLPNRIPTRQPPLPKNPPSKMYTNPPIPPLNPNSSMSLLHTPDPLIPLLGLATNQPLPPSLYHINKSLRKRRSVDHHANWNNDIPGLTNTNPPRRIPTSLPGIGHSREEFDEQALMPELDSMTALRERIEEFLKPSAATADLRGEMQLDGCRVDQNQELGDKRREDIIRKLGLMSKEEWRREQENTRKREEELDLGRANMAVGILHTNLVDNFRTRVVEYADVDEEGRRIEANGMEGVLMGGERRDEMRGEMNGEEDEEELRRVEEDLNGNGIFWGEEF